MFDEGAASFGVLRSAFSVLAFSVLAFFERERRTKNEERRTAGDRPPNDKRQT
jgi:hypothetical protein